MPMALAKTFHRRGPANGPSSPAAAFPALVMGALTHAGSLPATPVTQAQRNRKRPGTRR
jgi:hypothetical protein